MNKNTIASIAEVNPPFPKHIENKDTVSFVTMADVSESGRLLRASTKEFVDVKSGFTRFAENDVLLAKITPCMENGKGALVRNLTNGIGCGSTEFHVLRAKRNNSSEFIYQVTKDIDFRLKAEMKMTGSAGQQRVPASFFFEHLIYIPSPAHQQKIARILTTVDNIIEKTESAIEKYKAIKQGIMYDLFTRGIDVKTGKLRPSYEDAPELYKETELGMVPKEWEVKRLEEFVYMKSGDGITSESIEVMGDYPVYGGNGLRGYAKKYTHSGDFVLIGRQGALCGNVFRVKGKFFASEHAVVVTVLNSGNVDWLTQKLKFMKLNKYSEASAQPGLAVTKLLSLSVALPKENEQKEVSERFLILNSKLKIERKALSKYQKLKQALMQDILTGKKEVRPDPEDFDRE